MKKAIMVVLLFFSFVQVAAAASVSLTSSSYEDGEDPLDLSAVEPYRNVSVRFRISGARPSSETANLQSSISVQGATKVSASSNVDRYSGTGSARAVFYLEPGQKGSVHVYVYGGGVNAHGSVSAKAIGSGDDEDPDEPGDGETPQVISLTDALGRLNVELASSVSVSAITPSAATMALIANTVSDPTPITTVPRDSFAAKTYPDSPLPNGANALAPTFSSNIPLGSSSGTVGNMLALKMGVSPGSDLIEASEWRLLSGTQRVALLETYDAYVAYEYVSPATPGFARLVGLNGAISWNEAVSAGIVKFDADGGALNYVVVDSEGAPFAAGSVLVVPDGKTDGSIVDPVWLLYGGSSVTPPPSSQTLTLSPASLRFGDLEIMKWVSLISTPTLTSGQVVNWHVQDPEIATIVFSSNDDCAVRPLSSGRTVLTANINGTSSVVSCSIVVDVPATGGGGGCNAGLGVMALLLLGGAFSLRKRRLMK